MKQKQIDHYDLTDQIFNIHYIQTAQVTAYLANFKTYSLQDETGTDQSALLLFFIDQMGDWYKAIYLMQPYFLLEVTRNFSKEVMVYLESKYEKTIAGIEEVQKIDLEQVNHLAGITKVYIKLKFRTIMDLITIRSTLRQLIEKNKRKKENDHVKKEPPEHILDMREYDVPYHQRVCIDTGLRVGKWFRFTIIDKHITQIAEEPTLVTRPDLKYLAFDIETHKQPLKFPDAKIDPIIMISLMYERQAYLITNRQIVGQDVVAFEYVPKPEFECSVVVYNEYDELGLLKRFIQIIQEYKPLIITSFNGDKFDWPYIDKRAQFYNIQLEQTMGLKKQDDVDEYHGRYLIHLDCFYWVERDAYLPQGSHGLKAVTKAKLGYDPVEVDPELMVPLAKYSSQDLAEYSVSDAVATYFLYQKHIHDFIFALTTIIPLHADEVLRKGSGTLCEALLMAKAYIENIVFPNKKKEAAEKFYKGHLLDSETYIGGKVECLASGVYRQDFKQTFHLSQSTIQTLINKLEDLLKFVVKIEWKKTLEIEEVQNYEEVKNDLENKLNVLLQKSNQPWECLPMIYHLDVAAMYPNIILTNRLQPVAIVDHKICSGCIFNSEENQCKRNLDWQWRGEYFPLQRNEYENIKANLEVELGNNVANDVQQKLLRQRIKMYCQKTYHKQHVGIIELKTNTVCMRENPFYVDTVRDFRDRRYEFKELVKVWKGKMEEANKKENAAQVKDAKDRMALYESLQLAHKIILNSFYGYVMRKGARWYSMEMAAMVTHIGSSIISDAKKLIDGIGKPLELDTDGIWCLLPQGFPEDVVLKFKNGKNLKFSYPCFISNMVIYEKYSNPQYQKLVDINTLEYNIKREMSIFFEVDGPYRAMIIPAAKEENKQLKKRYVVYNKNGTIAEIKGFELKRRGELQIIKVFQKEIFNVFLAGTTLAECFAECGKVAQKWLYLLINKGAGLDDKELIEYIGETKILSKDIKDYDKLKGVAITAGKRLAEFLGSDIIKGAGLNCSYVISKKPIECPVTERAVPISIFETEDDIKRKFLRKWLKDTNMSDDDLEMRKIIDWDYYIERLGGTIQKILVIPAALQKIKNPVPEVPYPDWLTKRIKENQSGFIQSKVDSFFKVVGKDQQMVNKFKQQSQAHQPAKNPQSPMKRIAEAIPTKNIFKFELDFKEWLKIEKANWLIMYKQKKDKKSPFKGKNQNIMLHFKNQEQLLHSKQLHILSILQTETPGVYILWLFPEQGILQQLTLTIQRKFYVNSYTKQREDFKLVKKNLPREQKTFHLYELTFNEDQFQKEYSGFDHCLSDPNIEGIYELLLPLSFKTISDLGNIVKLTKNAKSLKGVFKMEDIQAQWSLGNTKEYLWEKDVAIRWNSISIISLTIGDKYVFTYWNPNESEIIFVLIHKFNDQNKYSKLIKENLNKRILIIRNCEMDNR